MSHGSPHCTGSSPSSPDPSAVEPFCPDPIAYLPPYVSDVRLAQPFSASSSTLLGRIPTAQELEEELQGQARMAAKVQEVENKKASKARSREGVRGQWWPCETTDAELRELQNEGMISEHWSFTRDSDIPNPDADERVMTKAWVERGLSLPCSEFFLSVLDTYGLQPHNICPNSYLLLSNFATLCEGHLGIRPDVKLAVLFPSEEGDEGQGHAELREHDFHAPTWPYVSASRFPRVRPVLECRMVLCEERVSSERPRWTPALQQHASEELASWSFIPTFAQTPILEKAARRISWLVHDGLTGAQLTLRGLPGGSTLRYNARLMCAYTGADDLLRVTRHDLPADSLKRRFKTLVKIPRGQQVPELIKDISTHDKCPPLDSLAEENLRTILRVPVSGDSVEEDPEDPEEEEERVPRKAAPRPSKRPRAKVSSSDAGCSSEASAKKPKVVKPPPLDSRKAERQRLKMLSTAGRPSRPNIPGAANPNPTTARTNVQEHITKYMQKKSPAIGPSTPVPPSAPQAPLQPSPPPADQSPTPAAPTPPEVIPVSSDRVSGDGSGGKGPINDETEGRKQGDAEVNSSGKAEATTGDMVVFPKNFGDPADLTSTPKAYATKFFNKLTEAEKWELEQDFLNAMLNNAWGKPDVETSEIQDVKKNIGEFFDKLVCKQKEQKALHYDMHKNIALQRRVTISQAEKIQHFQAENAALKKQLSEAQGASSSLAAASSELETLRAAHKNLEAKLAVAEQKISEKNSELIRKTGEFELKRQTDSDIIQKQQKEIGGLRKYMETAESCWDLLNSDVMDPLGYDEERRSQFPCDDLLQLAGEDCKDLISASRKICHNLNIKKSRVCDVRKLIKRMDLLPELVVDLQSSSARGAAAMSLAMCLAHNPSLNLDLVTSGVPPECNVNALLDAVSGYDTRIARRIRHDEFYEKVVLPADEPLEAEHLEDREAENRPAQSGSQYTWTSSKNQGGAASPTAAEAEEDEDVSSPAKVAEKETPTDAGGADANVETSLVEEK
ncbi:hypothetical protein QYE76_056629 [Lolium multiflorum]|uniref:Transposase (putative) gypsy type domain-containing protein n=1 Tax=Lolium multiflorum TaxID=4521 RepID=A0AAD8WQQ1_LOLMU|nr:hypothetical protein QYE76_056629 [Lolium multiflorum]